MNAHEPLKPVPQWVYTKGAGHHMTNGDGGSIESPRDYTKGFEDGAYALADQLNEVIGDGGSESVVYAMRILLAYRTGNVRPVRGWPHEPKRS